ncbi:hypothetical protein ASPZODRAFT_132304 [Penicilliopsis zonata CBS 506.65]|uniref:Uncharacterized protein n=1 Tax=Penicilliopsis zonata CBS 506.65 TaxID=1073090 RepID=A0A1L9SJQ2_9EURO|nr:hypothetical protein ASPZODRAFT_132304 [Penicilliopsis zonata CBS 506.65]OJJ47316.1 hypothetical protein ASPZODRAFT_132304 [Penicilliopsis zonata CBS 506.65]
MITNISFGYTRESIGISHDGLWTRRMAPSISSTVWGTNGAIIGLVYLKNRR